MKTWKQEKARAFRRYILDGLTKEGIAVRYNPYKKYFTHVRFKNYLLNIDYDNTITKSEKTIDADIARMVNKVEDIKKEIFNAWGEHLDTMSLVADYFNYEDLIRAFASEQNRNALLLCWYHDDERINDIKQYEQNIRNDYLDLLYGK